MRVFARLFLLVGMITSGCSLPSPKQTADYIFENAAIYTVNDEQPWASAIAVRGNKIIYVGDAKGVSAHKGSNTKVIDATGKMIMPGFIDAHVHPIWAGNGFIKINLKPAKTREEFQSIIVNFRKENPDVTSITGGAWIFENFKEALPEKEWVDAVVSDIPVMLYDHFGHTALANSKALELAGLDANTPDPDGGHLDRDPVTGELTGLVREGPAFDMVQRGLPEGDDASDYKALKMAFEHLNSFGITSFVTAYMIGEPLGETFVELHRNKALTARTTLSFHVTNEKPVNDVLPAIQQRRAELEQLNPEFIRADIVKMFLDGVFLSHTAAMLEPYYGENSKHNYQGYMFSDEELMAYSAAFNQSGFGLHYHTVGDGAARQALDTLETIVNRDGPLNKIPMISHVTSVQPEDRARFGPLGVAANSQFFWGKYHEIVTKREAYLGPERSRNFYAFGDIARHGGVLVAGSDWPVSTPNPFFAMEVAATRPYTSIHTPEDQVFGSEQSWLPEHKVDVETMIRAFTIEGAKIQSWDHMIGSLEVGKLADIILVDQNILEVPLSDLHKTRVLMTMLDGELIYEQGEPAPAGH